jgi:glutaredoxin
MKVIYQLSRETCQPCKILKERINTLDNRRFEYEYVDIDSDIDKDSIEYTILKTAQTLGIRSLPIVGVFERKKDKLYLDYVTSIRYNNITSFINEWQKESNKEEE